MISEQQQSAVPNESPVKGNVLIGTSASALMKPDWTVPVGGPETDYMVA